MKERTTPGSIINLQITANILFLTLLIVSGVEFFITDQEFQQVKNNVGLIDLQEDRVANMQIMVQMLTDLVLINQGVYGPLTDKLDALEIRARSIMRNAILELREIQESILIDNVDLDGAQLRQKTQKVIPMYIQNSGKIDVENFSMVEAVYRILNIGLAVTNLPLTEISMNNDKVFFVVYNLFNDFR